MGTNFDSPYCNSKFGCPMRHNAFDVRGIKVNQKIILCAVGSLLAVTGGTTVGALQYDFSSGTWSRFASKTFSSGLSISIINKAVYIGAYESTNLHVWKYQGGVLTRLGRVLNSISPNVSKIIAYGSGLLVVGRMDRFTPEGGSQFNTCGGVYWDGSSWYALTKSIGEELILNDAVVKGGVAYAADSGSSNYGCVRLNGLNWVSQSTGLQPTGASGACLAVYQNELYLGGGIYLTGWVLGGLVKWNGSSWVGVGFPSYTPQTFASTPSKLVIATATSGRVYEFGGSSFDYISGSNGINFSAERDGIEEKYYVSQQALAGKIWQREAGTWSEISGIKYPERIAYGEIT